MINKTKAKNAIELYTGDTFQRVEVYEDPKVTGTWALRVFRSDGQALDFLVCGYRNDWTVRQMHDALEECVFEAWPPTSNDRPTQWTMSFLSY